MTSAMPGALNVFIASATIRSIALESGACPRVRRGRSKRSSIGNSQRFTGASPEVKAQVKHRHATRREWHVNEFLLNVHAAAQSGGVAIHTRHGGRDFGVESARILLNRHLTASPLEAHAMARPIAPSRFRVQSLRGSAIILQTFWRIH